MPEMIEEKKEAAPEVWAKPMTESIQVLPFLARLPAKSRWFSSLSLSIWGRGWG